MNNSLRVGKVFTDAFTGSIIVLRVSIGILYGHGIQSFLLCVLGIAPSVTSIPTTDSFVDLGLYAVLPIALTIVQFDGTSILSLHDSQTLSNYNSMAIPVRLRI
jgi:hypothetical protein